MKTLTSFNPMYRANLPTNPRLFSTHLYLRCEFRGITPEPQFNLRSKQWDSHDPLCQNSRESKLLARDPIVPHCC